MLAFHLPPVAPMSENLRHVEVEGHRIAVLSRHEDRDTTPLILLHGVALSPHIWTHILPPALAGRRWHAVGLPAHHPSEAPPDFADRPMPPELFGQGLAGVLAEIAGDRPCDLLGHSTGGYAALAIAAAAPERVRSICAVSAFAQGEWNGGIGLLQAVARLDRLGGPLFGAGLGLMRSHPAIARLAALAATNRPRACNAWPPLAPMLETVVADLKRTDRTALRHFMAAMHEHDIRDRLGAVRAPTLLVHGTADPVVPFAQARLIKYRVPHAQLERMAGIGHLPFGEAADRFEAILRQWYERFPDDRHEP